MLLLGDLEGMIDGIFQVRRKREEIQSGMMIRRGIKEVKSGGHSILVSNINFLFHLIRVTR